MNVRLLRQISFLVLTVTTVSVKAINSIEEMLIARTIQQRGINAIRQEIENAEDSQEITGMPFCGITTPIVLNIEMTFKKEDCDTDPLAKNIFEKIKEIELKSGYIPEAIKKTTDTSIFITNATNFISSNTRYYWLEENGVQVPAVQVKAQLTNKHKLKEFINTYNKGTVFNYGSLLPYAFFTIACCIGYYSLIHSIPHAD